MQPAITSPKFSTMDLSSSRMLSVSPTEVEDLVRKGRDLEKVVLSRAVGWDVQNRVLVYRNKTVVF